MNMKKVIMTLAAVLCCTMFVWAQDAQKDRNRKYNITLGNVQYAHHDEKMSADEAVGKIISGALTGKVSVEATKYEEDVKSAIIKGLSSAYRFNYNNGLLKVGDVVEEGNIVVDALITNIQATSDSQTMKDKDGKEHVTTWYKGAVEAVLTLKDAKSGEVIDNPTVGGWGSGNSQFSTSDKAILDAIAHLSTHVSNYLNKYRPIQANVIESGAAKKDKQKELYIDLGSSEGAFEGLSMNVYQVKKIAGREAKSKIGKVKIEAVEGDDISRCKVTSGAKDIKAALDAGEQLRVQSASR